MSPPGQRSGPPHGEAAPERHGHHTSTAADCTSPVGSRRGSSAPLPWRDLDAATRDLLANGDRHGRYASQSEVAMSLAVRFRNHGRGLGEYVDALTDSANAASGWYRDLRDGRAGRRRKTARGRAKAVAELERCWAKAGRLPAPRHLDLSDVHERCERARAFAERTLTGRTRASRLCVLDVVLAEARRWRTVRVLAPERLVAESAGVHRHTARRALGDLVAAGVLDRAESSCDGNVFLLNPCTFVVPDSPHFYGVRKTGTTRVHRGAAS